MPEATYDLTKKVLLKHLQTATTRLKALSDTANALAASAIHSGSVSGNTVSFFTSTDGSGTAAFSFDFPSELVLDQLKTQFVGNFAFSSTTYAGATDPNLDSKPVLVIAVKDTAANGTVTTNYSFLDMTTLVDTYQPADNSININGYNVGVKISADTGNALSLHSDGLFVDISGKMDKVTTAVEGHTAIFDANGNVVDSGHGIATDAEVNAMLDEILGASSGN